MERDRDRFCCFMTETATIRLAIACRPRMPCRSSSIACSLEVTASIFSTPHEESRIAHHSSGSEPPHHRGARAVCAKGELAHHVAEHHRSESDDSAHCGDREPAVAGAQGGALVDLLAAG